MTFIEKVKLWVASTGLTNVGWAAGFIGGLVLGWTFIAGACFGLFIHFNYSKIKELIGMN